jgi:hypothetical protein
VETGNDQGLPKPLRLLEKLVSADDLLGYLTHASLLDMAKVITYDSL